MPEVIVKNLHSKTIHWEAKSERLLDILLSATDWMHACGKKGNCTTCTAIVIRGADHLGDLTDAERRFIKLGRLRAGERLACQATVTGNITVEVPEIYKLPHMDYSN